MVDSYMERWQPGGMRRLKISFSSSEVHSMCNKFATTRGGALKNGVGLKPVGKCTRRGNKDNKAWWWRQTN